jgi:hypothetical protein
VDKAADNFLIGTIFHCFSGVSEGCLKFRQIRKGLFLLVKIFVREQPNENKGIFVTES